MHTMLLQDTRHTSWVGSCSCTTHDIYQSTLLMPVQHIPHNTTPHHTTPHHIAPHHTTPHHTQGSGKTHTMSAIMRCATRDIFQHVEASADRCYVVRLSALEIYNEVVKDLLPNSNCGVAAGHMTSSAAFASGGAVAAGGLKVS